MPTSLYIQNPTPSAHETVPASPLPLYCYCCCFTSLLHSLYLRCFSKLAFVYTLQAESGIFFCDECGKGNSSIFRLSCTRKGNFKQKKRKKAKNRVSENNENCFFYEDKYLVCACESIFQRTQGFFLFKHFFSFFTHYYYHYFTHYYYYYYCFTHYNYYYHYYFTHYYLLYFDYPDEKVL